MGSNVIGIKNSCEVCRQFNMSETFSLATAMLIARESKAVSGVVSVEGSSSSVHCLRSSANSSTVRRIGGI